MIDIILATYNGRRFLKEQIDSILNQTVKDFTLLIRDDDSTDGTNELLDIYASMYPDRIKLIRDDKKAGSAKQNFFLLMKECDADYIMFADQDDVWEKDKVEKALACMKKTEKKYGKKIPILCHGDLEVVNSELKTINGSMGKMQKLNYHRRKLRDYLVQNNITGCTMIINKKLNRLCREMPEEAIMHDWWLGLIASAFGKVRYIGEAGIKYRQHEKNAEGAKNLKSPFYLLKKFFSGSEVRASLEKTYRQAEKFHELFSGENKPALSLEDEEMVLMYCKMAKGNKLKKLLTIAEYRFTKSGFARELGYLFYV